MRKTFFLATLIFILFLTSSFDILLNIKVGGFSLRFVFFIALLLFVFLCSQDKFLKSLKFLGLTPFLIWTIFLIIFIPNTTLLSRSIGYIVWLIINAVIVICLTYVVHKENFRRIFNLYLLSFLIIAWFGIIQFLFGLFGIDILITQWWIPGKVPRVNGFCYEPSYYATYLIIPWCIYFFMIMQNKEISKKYRAVPSLLVVTVAIILSSSRLGFSFITLITLLSMIFYAFKSIIMFKINFSTLSLFIILGLSLLIFTTYLLTNLERFSFLLNGTGINNSSSHSASERMTGMTDTFQAFKESPIIGYSLGGVAIAVGRVRGIIITDQENAKKNEGLNIFYEVLAASGLLGFLFFIYYLFIVVKKSLLIANVAKNEDSAYILKAMLFALIAELIILSFNQNILRPYLWIHIAVINCTYYLLKTKTNKTDSYSNELQNNF